MQQARHAQKVSRREVLGSSIVATLAITLGIASRTGRLSSAEAQTGLGPEDALKRLMTATPAMRSGS